MKQALTLHAKKTSALFLALLMALSMAVVAMAEETLSVVITVPSVMESTICSGRDFYVQGSFSGMDLPEDAIVSVEVENALGDVVRTVSNNIKGNTNLNVNYEKLSYYNAADPLRNDLLTSGMPDLIYDPVRGIADSFRDATIKCYYDNNSFCALIPGGQTATSIDNGMNWVDGDGVPFTAFAAGSYTITVTVADNAQNPLGSATKAMTIGDTANKLLTRFSPATHLSAATAFANANSLRIYNDPFPGYWSKGSLFCEILPAWRAADATEYLSGMVHFLIYNVKASATTYAVEIGTLQSVKDIESRLASYYYDIGEPVLPDADQTAGTVTAFEQGDKLALTRAETVNTAGDDGVYNQDNPDVAAYDLDLADGVKAEVGDTLALYGVTAPIQIDDADIVYKGDNAYTLNNKIAKLSYDITVDGETTSFEKAVTLNRKSGGWDNFSELEFRHLLAIDESMKGETVSVAVTGYDAHGAKVAGTDESFSIQVAGDEEPLPNDLVSVIRYLIKGILAILLQLMSSYSDTLLTLLGL